MKKQTKKYKYVLVIIEIVWKNAQYTFHEVNYRLPKKLGEGYVFTCVCPQGEGSPQVTITHDALDLSVQGHIW